ncbi:MAG: hypothetical protein FWD73_02490 [Polyangiaceae bacterium]|nr:hypothetical protein [Polyangiaceae bacterium]
MASPRLRGHLMTTGIVLGSVAATAGAGALLVGSCAERDRLHRAQTAQSAMLSEGSLTKDGDHAITRNPTTLALLLNGNLVNPTSSVAKEPVATTELTSAELPETSTLPSLQESSPQTPQSVPPPALQMPAAAEQPEQPSTAPANDASHQPASDDQLATAIAKAFAKIESERQERQQEQQAAEPSPEPPNEQAAAEPTPQQLQQPPTPTQGEPTGEGQNVNAALSPEPPSFSAGAGQFLTEPPFWSSSSMGAPDPSAGAGRFDTERSIPPGIVYYGYYGYGGGAPTTTTAPAAPTESPAPASAMQEPRTFSPPGALPRSPFSPMAPVANPFAGKPFTTQK